MNVTWIKILTLVVGSMVAFSIFGLTYAAIEEDGILRAVSGGLLLGLCGFAITVLAAKLFVDLGK